MSVQTVSVPTSDGQQMPAHLWLPEGGEGPGIVVLQEIFGVSDYIRRRAQDLTDLGYVVLAPEIYWRTGDVGPFEGATGLEQGMAAVETLDWTQAVLDGASAVQALRANAEVNGPVGLLGFCFGGGLAFNVAAHLESDAGGAEPVDGMVSYYGSALRGLVDAMTVTTPSLHHFGLADSYIDESEVRRIEQVVTQQPDTTFCTYEGADHAFDNSDFPLHHPAASALAWERTVQWLGRHLPVRNSDGT